MKSESTLIDRLREYHANWISRNLEVKDGSVENTTLHTSVKDGSVVNTTLHTSELVGGCGEEIQLDNHIKLDDNLNEQVDNSEFQTSDQLPALQKLNLSSPSRAENEDTMEGDPDGFDEEIQQLTTPYLGRKKQFAYAKSRTKSEVSPSKELSPSNDASVISKRDAQSSPIHNIDQSATAMHESQFSSSPNHRNELPPVCKNSPGIVTPLQTDSEATDCKTFGSNKELDVPSQLSFSDYITLLKNLKMSQSPSEESSFEPARSPILDKSRLARIQRPVSSPIVSEYTTGIPGLSRMLFKPSQKHKLISLKDRLGTSDAEVDESIRKLMSVKKIKKRRRREEKENVNVYRKDLRMWWYQPELQDIVEDPDLEPLMAEDYEIETVGGTEESDSEISDEYREDSELIDEEPEDDNVQFNEEDSMTESSMCSDDERTEDPTPEPTASTPKFSHYDLLAELRKPQQVHSLDPVILVNNRASMRRARDHLKLRIETEHIPRRVIMKRKLRRRIPSGVEIKEKILKGATKKSKKSRSQNSLFTSETLGRTSKLTKSLRNDS